MLQLVVAREGGGGDKKNLDVAGVEGKAISMMGVGKYNGGGGGKFWKKGWVWGGGGGGIPTYTHPHTCTHADSTYQYYKWHQNIILNFHKKIYVFTIPPGISLNSLRRLHKHTSYMYTESLLKTKQVKHVDKAEIYHKLQLFPERV